LAQKRLAILLLILVFLSPYATPLGCCVAAARVDRVFTLAPPVPGLTSEASAVNFTISYPVPRPSSVVGSISVLVIAVEFPDYNHTLSIEQVASQTIDQLDDYYNHVSYGSLSILGNVVGWVRMPYKLSSYGFDNGPFVDDQDGDGYPDTWRLLRDAIPLIKGQVDVTQYQEVLVLHAGYGQESSRDPNDIWSVAFMRWTVETAQRVFESFAIIPEYEARGLGTVGVTTHEFGHLLGLPDLYSQTSEQVGLWDLMARGVWNGNPPGSTPSELIAWDRIFLGWLTADHILNVTGQRRANATVDPIEDSSSRIRAIRVQPSSIDPKRYYLVEVRQKIGYDIALPSTGVLITYIDETSSNPVKVIDAVQTTSTLDDAPFQVGQKYADVPNSVKISILSVSGSSFSVDVDTSAPSPDVGVASLSLNPQTVRPNGTATLVIDVVNNGALKANGFYVEVYLNETAFSSRKISLKPGESQEIQLSWTPKKAGSYTFKVVLDAQKVLADNHREDNIKTLNTIVGYALTLEIRPPGAGMDIEWWLSVNGNNQTYAGVGEFQIGVVPGTNTLMIQPAIYLNPSSRYVFRQWNDGSTANPRTIEAFSDVSLGVDFDAQYSLSLDTSGGSVSGSGWYKPGTLVTVTATSPSTLVADQSRLIFQNWSGDMQSDSTVLVVNMTQPYSLTANWKTQYYLNIQSQYAAVGGGWYDADSQAVVSLSSLVVPGNGVRYIFQRWYGDLSGANQSESVTMSGPKTVSALWATQYELKIESNCGHTIGAGWYDPGTQATFGVDALIDDVGNDTRHVFTRWTGDASGTGQQGVVIMDGPKTVHAEWTTQYLVTFITKGVRNGTIATIVLNGTPHQVKAPESLQLWLDAGGSVSFSANTTLSEGFRRYSFQSWKNSTGEGVKSPQNVLQPETYTATYRELSMFPCIIATVTFGSEVTPEVQLLRNFRDHLALSTRAGSAFMGVFNAWYYSFSPQVADFIVQHDGLRDPLRVVLYPLLGILEISSATYYLLQSTPELAITMTGIVASALIGLVYLTPTALVLLRLSRRKTGALRVLKVFPVLLLVALVVLAAGELTGSLALLSAAASLAVLTMLLGTPVLFALELMSLRRHVGFLAKMRATLRAR
jgi:M6 family metalloprotease-like protein